MGGLAAFGEKKSSSRERLIGPKNWSGPFGAMGDCGSAAERKVCIGWSGVTGADISMDLTKCVCVDFF